MITMREIDELRDELGKRREELRNRKAAIENGHNAWRDIEARDGAEYRVACAERNVERAVVEWAAQGCREVPSEAEIVAMLADAKPIGEEAGKTLARGLVGGIKSMIEHAARTPSLHCACSTFDDGSSFMLGSFAGGAAAEGAFSYVVCVRQTKDATTLIRYVRDEVKP